MSEKQLQELLKRGGCAVLAETPAPAQPEKKRRSYAYRRDDLGGLYVRSAWEANIARYLNWLIEQKQGVASWQYEVDEWEFPIKRGSRFYKCDFKVTMDDSSVWYWEVKGHMDRTSRTKLKRMKKYHPDVDILVIANWTPDDRFPYRVESYRDIAQTMKPLIAEWE